MNSVIDLDKHTLLMTWGWGLGLTFRNLASVNFVRGLDGAGETTLIFPPYPQTPHPGLASPIHSGHSRPSSSPPAPHPTTATWPYLLPECVWGGSSGLLGTHTCSQGACGLWGSYPLSPMVSLPCGVGCGQRGPAWGHNSSLPRMGLLLPRFKADLGGCGVSLGDGARMHVPQTLKSWMAFP